MLAKWNVRVLFFVSVSFFAKLNFISDLFSDLKRAIPFLILGS